MALRWRPFCNILVRQYSQASSSGPSSPPPSKPPATADKIKVDVPGLSEACVEKPKEAVGPGVDPLKKGDYKVPEYFCYNANSYFEAEVEMSKYRLPQPVAPMK